MGMSAGGGGGAKSDINVTPLVDVCLVLLIIFMVMVPRNVPELSVRIPPESKRPPTQKPPSEEALVIGLTKDSGLTLNRNPVDKQKLSSEITRQLEFREKKVVFVDFDSDANYGESVEVMDLAKKAGADVVGIMRKKDYKMPESLKDI